MGETAIRAALLAENEEKCRPDPLPVTEVEDIATSIARYAPAEVPWRVGETIASKFRPLSAGELLSEEDPGMVPWVWTPFLPSGALSLLAAYPKLGKSTLAYALASL